jgi:FkbM family methyltransferase
MGIMARRKGIGGDETEAKEAQTSISRSFCQTSVMNTLLYSYDFRQTGQLNRVNRIASSLDLIFGSIKCLKNWYPFISTFRKKEAKIFVAKSRNNSLALTMRMPFDVGAIRETWFDHEYVPSNDYLRDCKNILDIGGHIGSFSCWALAHSKAKIVTVEPTDESFKVLVENIKLNGFENRTTLLSDAVGANSGERIISVMGEERSGTDSLYTQSENQKIVNCIGINELVSNYGPFDFVKIDTEGAEQEIILSLNRISISKISAIALEYHEDIVPNGKVMIQSFLTGNGFKVKFLKQRGTTGIILAEKPTT